MRIADADGLIKHFENVVDVKLFTPANIITIIKTFSGEVEEGSIYRFRSEDNNIIVTKVDTEDLISRRGIGKAVFHHSYSVPVLDTENKVLAEVLNMIHKAPPAIGGAEP